MREQLQKQLSQAEAQHEKNAAAYRKALADRRAIDKTVRKTCDVASESANTLAALREAVAKLPPPKLEAVE